MLFLISEYLLTSTQALLKFSSDDTLPKNLILTFLNQRRVLCLIGINQNNDLLIL